MRPERLVRSGRWSARAHPLLGAGSCRPTSDRLAESTSADRSRRTVMHGVGEHAAMGSALLVGHRRRLLR